MKKTLVGIILIIIFVIGRGSLQAIEPSKDLVEKSKVQDLFKELNRVADENSSYKLSLEKNIENIASRKDVPFLIEIVEDKNNKYKDYTKNVAIILLANFGDKQAIPVLINALGKRELRNNAAFFFCHIKDSRCVDKLLEALKQTVGIVKEYQTSSFEDYVISHNSEKGNIEIALTGNAEVRIIPELIKMLSSPYIDVRISAIKVLSKMVQTKGMIYINSSEIPGLSEDINVVSKLVKMLDDEDPFVFSWTLIALEGVKRYIKEDVSLILDRRLQSTDDPRFIQAIKDKKTDFKDLPRSEKFAAEGDLKCVNKAEDQIIEILETIDLYYKSQRKIPSTKEGFRPVFSEYFPRITYLKLNYSYGDRLLDPWGNPYEYNSYALPERLYFTVLSFGPDKIKHTADDIIKERVLERREKID